MEWIRRTECSDFSELNDWLGRYIPFYFHEMERNDFATYWEKNAENYWVLGKGDRLLAAGGVHWIPERQEARLSWDICHPDFRRNGYGTKLLRFRMMIMATNYPVRTVVVRTSQQSFLFYQKNGFELKYRQPDFWAPGFDLVYMEHPGPFLGMDEKGIQ
ncbi:MAG: GNAT family N-acetyltransferase [Cytophagaceae bacterium]|jgi:ribosomal protein S18 acetylase RimI-like enzyme|nr:GNAT family N-acetyltransferase [Cytophagaceae bacterium]